MELVSVALLLVKANKRYIITLSMCKIKKNIKNESCEIHKSREREREREREKFVYWLTDLQWKKGAAKSSNLQGYNI